MLNMSTICFHCIYILLLVVPTVLAQVLSPESSVVVSGSTVQLTCMASSGDLPISFTWSYSSGDVINPVSSNDTSSTISITPTMSSDFGTYICMASNTFGNGSDVINIIQAGIVEL